MKKTKILLNEQEVSEFQLFQKIKMLVGLGKWEYLQHQRIKGGRLIIHLKVDEDLQKK